MKNANVSYFLKLNDKISGKVSLFLTMCRTLKMLIGFFSYLFLKFLFASYESNRFIFIVNPYPKCNISLLSSVCVRRLLTKWNYLRTVVVCKRRKYLVMYCNSFKSMWIKSDKIKLLTVYYCVKKCIFSWIKTVYISLLCEAILYYWTIHLIKTTCYPYNLLIV